MSPNTTPRAPSVSAAIPALAWPSVPVVPVTLGEPIEPLHEKIEERACVEVDADVGVHRPVGAVPAVDHRSSAAELGLELDLDVAVDGRHEVGPDQLCDD